MMESLYEDAKRLFQFTELDIGRYARIKGRGMRFSVRVFDAAKAGRLFLMNMKGFGGLMKMETAVFTPLQLDGPIFSADEVAAFGRSTLVLELYDTTLSHPDFGALDTVKSKYAQIPSYDPGSHSYYDFRLPQSDYKKGRGIRSAVRSMAEEYSETYFSCLRTCAPVSPEKKKQRNAEFAVSLYENGGPAVNQFKQMIGEERTEEFLMRYMFCSI